MRKERDNFGEVNLEDDEYYGINSYRAYENFPISRRKVHPEIIKAIIVTKKACAISNEKIGLLNASKATAIIDGCDELLLGDYSDQFITDSLQGGAGTSTNMNVNEVIANKAIKILGGKQGDYHIVSPLDDVNMSQSTNDVYPTAVRIAAIGLLDTLSESFSKLQEALQKKEEEFSHVLKVGRTQLQDALPIFLGQEFGAYAQAISRDRWRLYKSKERLRQVNLGGTAVGTGLNAKREYIFKVIEELRMFTGFSLARTDYMMDPTQNCDVFVEVSGLLKASAVNLSKIANDLRLMSSGPRAGFGEIEIPPVQAGSTIMPGKVNPVILEAVNQVAFQVMGNDQVITFAASSGQFELNAFLPVIGENLIESIELLNNVINILVDKCIIGIKANEDKCASMVEHSLSISAALIHHIGYEKSQEIVNESIKTNKTIREIIIDNRIIDTEKIEKILDPYQLTKPGIPGT